VAVSLPINKKGDAASIGVTNTVNANGQTDSKVGTKVETTLSPTVKTSTGFGVGFTW